MPTVPAINDIKKDLYKSKEMANFSHYNRGELFYSVKVLGDVYQFPLKTTEYKEKEYNFGSIGLVEVKITTTVLDYSDELGFTSFSSDIKGSELIRWIQKAIDKREFIKIKSNAE